MIKYTATIIMSLVLWLIYNNHVAAVSKERCKECRFVHVERGMIYVASYTNKTLSCNIGDYKFLLKSRGISALYIKPLNDENNYRCEITEGK